MYCLGHGVGQNYQEAAQWFQSAVKQGNTKAQCNLGARYSEGKGVSKHYVFAHVWVTRAAEQGFPRVVTLLETLEGLMIPEQLSEAQRLEAQGFMGRQGADSGGLAAQGVNRMESGHGWDQAV